MQPFTLIDRIEKFKSNYNVLSWPAGAFEYELVIGQSLSKNQLDTLCEWLSENCTRNFVIVKKQSRILAGGTSDNKLAWKQRRKYKTIHDEQVDIVIRLSSADVMLFRMVWITD